VTLAAVASGESVALPIAAELRRVNPSGGDAPARASEWSCRGSAPRAGVRRQESPPSAGP